MVARNKNTLLLFSLLLFSFLLLVNHKGNAFTSTTSYTEEQRETLLRFGIAAPFGINGYDISSIHLLTFLDWNKENSNVPEGVEYIHVIKVSDEIFADGELLNIITPIILNNMGDVWIIGNEPDRKSTQDDLTPEKYAERFFEVSTIIKNADPGAKVGFGSIVQPTPIRIRYLERSLNKLAELAGSMENALAMIDIWTIHSFILNEDHQPGSWGADVPPGFDCNIGDCNDAFIIDDNFSQTYSIEIFKERIISFRNWMNSIGEREKPLWITEFGSLFPLWEDHCLHSNENNPAYCPSPPSGWPESEDNIGFLINSFNFLLNSSDDEIGMPADSYRLVQRWYWFSLNDNLYSFGGSLFDPDNNKAITDLGLAYKTYLDILLGPKIYLPMITK